MSKTIDYLFEDPDVPGQKFALVSIVGPHMPQKCDVWGLKVRGVCDSLEKAKTMTKRLMNIDKDYDIYTVEVGKFFPLAVEPHQVGNVEYQNEELNKLVKSYVENRELANEQWLARKNEMVKQAVREGKNQAELANRPEHPIAVLQRMKTQEGDIKQLQEQLATLQKELAASKTKFEGYSDEDKTAANKELLSALEEATSSGANGLSIDDIRNQLCIEDVGGNASSSSPSAEQIDSILTELKSIGDEATELQSILDKVDQATSPNVFNRLQHELDELRRREEKLKHDLTNSKMINTYINAQYPESQYEFLQDNVRE